jgi:hypothetical protein
MPFCRRVLRTCFGPRTPELVCKEIWTRVLAYNLIRAVMSQAAAKEGCAQRSISFKATLQEAKKDQAQNLGILRQVQISNATRCWASRVARTSRGAASNNKRDKWWGGGLVYEEHR